MDCKEQIVSVVGVAVPTGIGTIATWIVALLEHCPGFGVNVYVVVVVGSNAGDQVPKIPFVEGFGKLIVFPKQTGAIVANVGIVANGIGFITTVNGEETQPLEVFFAVIE